MMSQYQIEPMWNQIHQRYIPPILIKAKSWCDAAHQPNSPELTAFSTVKQAKERVPFKPTTTVRTYSSGNSNMIKEEKSKLYCSKHELNIFHLKSQRQGHMQSIPRIATPSQFQHTPRGGTMPNECDRQWRRYKIRFVASSY
mmetsp:Transcript_15466/g.28081  ORF Transcript_15466/g.28081 Transcript_15466/m.28081 type:complete len:142 (+) Transcript_15466:142-567(+)